MAFNKFLSIFLCLTFVLGYQRPNDRPSKHQELAGHRFLNTFNSSNSKLVSDYINVIAQDRQLRYWIGTSSGLAMFDEREQTWKTFLSSTSGLFDNEVEMIGQSKDDRLWFTHKPRSILDSRISCFDGSQWETIDVRTKINYRVADAATVNINPIHNLFQGKDRDLWFIVAEGIISFDGQTWGQLLKPPDTALNGRLTTYKTGLQDREGFIWIGCASRGVLRLDTRTGEWTAYNPMESRWKAKHDGLDGLREIRATGVKYIYEDRQQRLWFATGDGNIYVYNKRLNSWACYNLIEILSLTPRTNLSLTPDMQTLLVSAIYQTRAGDIMIATERGLAIFFEDKQKWHIFTPRNSVLPAEKVNTIFEDHIGRIWLGTSEGILLLEK